MISRFLTPAEQGYYFTFLSVVGLKVFFEMGFSTVLVQFASHEKAHLHWDADDRLVGDEHSRARLGSLIRLALRWYAVSAGLMLSIVLPVGIVFFTYFHQQAAGVNWFWPWIWLIIASSVIVFISAQLAILEGIGLVPEIMKMRIGDSMVSTSTSWGVMAAGGALFAGAVLNTCTMLWQGGWILRRYWKTLYDLAFRNSDRSVHISWKEEIWPFQWKIALSWLSGYLIFQLFNPILFAYHGAVVAGQMGISTTIAQGLMTISLSWISTKTPVMGGLIAKRRWQDLDKLFFSALWRSQAIMILGCTCCLACAYFLNHIGHPISRRILAPLPFTFVIVAAAFNNLILAQSIYLRAHKKEPFITMSLVSGLANAAGTFLVGKRYGALGLTATFFIITVLATLWATSIFFARRREWHLGEDSLPAAPTPLIELSERA